MGKKRKHSKQLIELLAALQSSSSKYEISPELAELLAAYGDPPTMPTYGGDAMEYLRAVNVFEKLSATPEAVARREAMASYFKAKNGAADSVTSQG